MDRTYLSFFSGALGLDLGLESAGLRLLAANEIDECACRTIFKNKPKLRLYACDIRSLTASKLKNDLGIKGGELFAIVGGPPCQAFSTAGKRLGLNDERGNVFLHFLDLIVRLQPKYAIFENVRGLLSAPLIHRPHEERGQGFMPLSSEERPGGALLRILQVLDSAGYATTFNLYNAANFGVPQQRERLFFFASREGAGVPFLVPTHSRRGEHPETEPWVPVSVALQSAGKRRHHYVSFSEKRLRFLRMLSAGQNWRNLPSSVQREAMGASIHAAGGKTGFFRRLDPDKPSPTLVTRPTMPATLLCHPAELRPLSIEEYAAIQTFPADFEFYGKLDDVYRQIGNAVPPMLARVAGHHLVRFDEGALTGISEPIRYSRYHGTDHLSWRASVEPNLLF